MTGGRPLHSASSLTSSRGRPLDEQCTNSWQHSTERAFLARLPSHLAWLDTFSLRIDQTWAVMKAPKVQRILIGLLVAIVVIVLVWHSFLSTFLAESKATWDYMNIDPDDGDVYGANRRVDLTGLIHLADMDPIHLPRSSKTKTDEAKKGKRLIFIGDIHGHMKELHALLKKAKYNPEKDHIVALGDMINKGPDSKGVVDFLMSHSASCVRGNHEDRILLMAKDIQASKSTDQQDEDDITTESKVSIKDREERKLARSLTSKQTKWLNSCPVILRIGEIHPFGQVVAVHGGLLPGVNLERQDPTAVMNMRIVDLKTHTPSQKHSQDGSVPWTTFWNRYERLLPAQQTLLKHKNTKHTTVVYGHDARRGVQMHAYTKGLDSGCGNGKALTAWVVGEYGKDRLVQVPNMSKGR